MGVTMAKMKCQHIVAYYWQLYQTKGYTNKLYMQYTEAHEKYAIWEYLE